MLTKRLALVAPMILFAAIAGQASAQTIRPMTEHSTHALTGPDSIQAAEFASDAGMPSQAGTHRYNGGPKSND